MNDIIRSVWDLAAEFMTDPKYMFINDKGINKVADDIKRSSSASYAIPRFPKGISENDPEKIEKLVLYELLANSVNYCYWYGKSDIRPGGGNATRMYEVLDEAAIVAQVKADDCCNSWNDLYLDTIVSEFQKGLSINRFPLLESRLRHIKEAEVFGPGIVKKVMKGCTVDKCISTIIENIPGFSNDLFLKRTFLFVMGLYRRRVGLFDFGVWHLPVPADYQVPKMLRHFECIEYIPGPLGAGYAIDNNIPIPEGSQMECEIRAATIIACKMIADYANCSCEQVDSYLWGKRNECSDLFHLTITTNY